MRGVLIDDQRIAGLQRTILHDVALDIGIGYIGLGQVTVLQGQVIPGQQHIDLGAVHALLTVGAGIQAALLGHLFKEVEGRIQVVHAAAQRIGAGQHRHLGGRTAHHVANGDGGAAVFQRLPGINGGGNAVRVDHGAHGAHVADAPLAVRVLGPIRDGIPSAGLVGLHHVHLHGGGAERLADIADVLRGGILLRLKGRKLLGGAHVGVLMGQAVLLAHSGPAAAPVGPVIRHAYRVDLALLFGFFQDGVQRHFPQVNAFGSRSAAAGGQGQGGSHHCAAQNGNGFFVVVFHGVLL